MSEMRLFDPAGNRLYLNAEERAAFLVEARKRPSEVRTSIGGINAIFFYILSYQPLQSPLALDQLVRQFTSIYLHEAMSLL